MFVSQFRVRISCESRESTRLGTRLKSFCASYPGLAQNYIYNSTMCICLLGWQCLFSVQRNSHQCACPVKIEILHEFAWQVLSVHLDNKCDKRTWERRSFSIFCINGFNYALCKCKMGSSYVNINQITFQHVFVLKFDTLPLVYWHFLRGVLSVELPLLQPLQWCLCSTGLAHLLLL